MLHAWKGMHDSKGVAYCLRKFQAWSVYPPLHLLSYWISHVITYPGDSTTLILLLEAMQNLSERAPVAEYAQAPLQSPTFWIG